MIVNIYNKNDMVSSSDLQMWQKAIQGIEAVQSSLTPEELSAFQALTEFINNENFEVGGSDGYILVIKKALPMHIKNRLLKIHLTNFVVLCEKYFKDKERIEQERRVEQERKEERERQEAEYRRREQERLERKRLAGQERKEKVEQERQKNGKPHNEQEQIEKEHFTEEPETKSENPNRKKLIIGVAAGFIVLCVIAAVFVFINNGEKKHASNTGISSANTQSNTQVQEASPAPQPIGQTAPTNSVAPVQETSIDSQPPEQTSSTNSTIPVQETTPSSQPVSTSNSGSSSTDNRSANQVQETRQAPQSQTNNPLPAFSTRLLREADIRGLSKQELRLLRNEIYARKGYRFNTRDLREYFETKEWYRPQFDDVDHLFNEFERENIKFIESHE